MPTRIIEQAVWGMLPKGVLGRNYYRRLFVYMDNNINYFDSTEKKIHKISLENCESENWIKPSF